MAKNKSKYWPIVLKCVQFKKNPALNSGELIKNVFPVKCRIFCNLNMFIIVDGRSPYEAMFGCVEREQAVFNRDPLR